MTASRPRQPSEDGCILFGGSGFLGSCILENYPDIISVGRTTPPTAGRHIHVDSLDDLGILHDVPFSKVIYVIGNSDNHGLAKERLAHGEPTTFDYHTFPLIQTLEQLKCYAIKKLIHFSTILMYDESKLTLPVTEDAPIDPYKNRYTMSKYLAEEACTFYSRWIPIVNVRSTNIYGPTRLQRFDLIHGLVRQLLTEGKGQVRSTRPERDFIYVEDVAHAVVRLLESDYTGTLNLGTGTRTSIGRIVDLLTEISGCPIIDLEESIGGPMRFQCDVRRLRAAIDWAPHYPIEAGLRRTYEVMKSLG